MQHADKQQALARLTSLEAEAKHLRTILEAPESILPEGTTLDATTIHCKGAPAALELHHALQILIQLRTMAGTSAPRGVITERSVAGDLQNCLEPKYSSERGKWEIIITSYSGVSTKLARISPPFNSWKEAEQARNTIGDDRLLAMFFTLHGFTPYK